MSKQPNIFHIPNFTPEKAEKLREASRSLGHVKFHSDHHVSVHNPGTNAEHFSATYDPTLNQLTVRLTGPLPKDMTREKAEEIIKSDIEQLTA